MAELLSLLREGFDRYRDVRGPMGFAQRQGNGKSTADEAEEYIAQLLERAERRRRRRVGRSAAAPEAATVGSESARMSRLRHAPKASPLA